MTSNAQNVQPKKKKKRGCGFGCLIIIIIIIVGLLGTYGWFWYQSIPKKSKVEKEYNTVPDYYNNK